jgi:uroporphyrinogen III methyltransferase/synthase
MGPGTEEALAERGLIADLIVESPNAEAVLAALRGRDLSRRRVLLPRAEEIHRKLLKDLRQVGAEVEDVPLYIASVPREPNRGALALLKQGEVDAVVFPASVAVTNLVGMLGDQTDLLRRVTIACVGPITVHEAQKAGLQVDVVAEPATPAGVVRALSEHAARQGSPSAVGFRGSK